MSGGSDDIEFSRRLARGHPIRTGSGESVDDVLEQIRHMVNEEASLLVQSRTNILSERMKTAKATGQTGGLADPLVLTPDQQVAPIVPQTRSAAPTSIDDPDNLFVPQSDTAKAALRELVTQIVREELEGAFGDDLSQRIRKMVRREIAQSLRITE